MSATRKPIISRRAVLRAGLGVVAGAGAVAVGAATPGTARAGNLPVVAAYKVRDLTGPALTGQFAAPWTDLGIPVRCPDGSMLFVCGDTFDGPVVPDTQRPAALSDWRAPVGLRSANGDPNALVIDGSVGGGHAESLVPEGHDGGTTAIPSDVFTIDGVMYLHLMRGVIFDTDHTDFWRSFDNGNTWEYLCQWPGDAHDGQFQQKTYAIADDGFCYVLSSRFNRAIPSGLLLHRVPQDQLGNPDAYQPWGWADGNWAWGNPPTTIRQPQNWGEICFRALGGRYVFTWLNADDATIRAQVFPLPTSDLTVTPQQVMIVNGPKQQQVGNVVTAPYGGFVVPGSTLDDLHLTVSQWYDTDDNSAGEQYRVMQYRVLGLNL